MTDLAVPTVLVVDEEDEALATTRSLLERAGHQCFVAASPQAALETFIRERPSLLIVAQSVLEQRGELVHRIRGIDGGVAVIMQGASFDFRKRRAVVREFDLQGVHDRNRDPQRLLELVECALASVRRLGRVRAAQDLRGLILAKLCHDLRGSLGTVQGYTDLLLSDPAAIPIAPILARLGTATDAALALAQEYLQLARLEAAGSIVRRESVSLGTLLVELRCRGARQIGERPLELVVDTFCENASIETDGEKLREILAQLLANAIKFTRSGAIHLGIRPGSDHTDFVVADTGPGIDAATRAGLYTPFYQVSDETLAAIPGQGLGLAIALRLSALIGASLSVASPERGGTVFTLSVPGALNLRKSAGAPTVH